MTNTEEVACCGLAWKGQREISKLKDLGRRRHRMQGRASCSGTLCWLKCGYGVGPNILEVNYNMGRS